MKGRREGRVDMGNPDSGFCEGGSRQGETDGELSRRLKMEEKSQGGGRGKEEEAADGGDCEVAEVQAGL